MISLEERQAALKEVRDSIVGNGFCFHDLKTKFEDCEECKAYLAARIAAQEEFFITGKFPQVLDIVWDDKTPQEKRF